MAPYIDDTLTHKIVMARIIDGVKCPAKSDEPALYVLAFRLEDDSILPLDAKFTGADWQQQLAKFEEAMEKSVGVPFARARERVVRLAVNNETGAVDFVGNATKPRWIEIRAEREDPTGRLRAQSDTPTQWMVHHGASHFLVANDLSLDEWRSEFRVVQISVELLIGPTIRIEFKHLGRQKEVAEFNFTGQQAAWMSDVCQWLLKLTSSNSFKGVSGKYVRLYKDFDSHRMVSPLFGGHSQSYGNLCVWH